MKRRIVLVLLGIIFWSSYSIAAVKEIVYDGKEIYIHTLKDHATEIIFPESITEIVRGFSADTYVIERKDTNPKVLEIMPTDDEIAEITVSGVSGEEYAIRFIKLGEFYSKVTILPMTQGVNNTAALTEPLKSQTTTTDNIVTVENKKTFLPDQQTDTHNSLVSFMPTPAAQDPPATENVDNKRTEVSIETKPPAELDTKITLKGNNLPLKIYLSTISQVTGYNVITTPEIDSQKTSINLENIEVWRAIKSLLYKFGYGFKVSQDDLIITESETRIFNIEMPAVDQNFTDETSNESFADNNNNNSSGSSSNQSSQDIKVGTKIYYENNSPKLSLWTDLENNIKSMITDKTGSYSINKVSGSIIVTDKPQILDKIGDLVSTINESLSRQQSFEIQIIEVTLTNDYENGIDWTAVTSAVKGLNSLNLSTNFTAQGFTSGQLLSLSSSGPTTTGGTTNNGVSMLIKALDSQGSVNVVSKPSITVSNMFPCVIQEVTSIPYISGTGQTIGNNVTQSNVTTSQVSDGLTMRLEAKIDDDKTVLNISAAVNTLDSMTNVPVGNGLTIQEPQVSTKSITTNVGVESGKSLILGGLISTTKTISQQGIPYLDKIPFIGGAFGYKGKSGQKTELVIIITPKKVIKNL